MLNLVCKTINKQITLIYPDAVTCKNVGTHLANRQVRTGYPTPNTALALGKFGGANPLHSSSRYTPWA
jgi:hypothetical protein